MFEYTVEVRIFFLSLPLLLLLGSLPPHSLVCKSKGAEFFFSWHRNSTDKRTIIENYDLVSLAIDEIVDDGIILETDPVIIAGRVSRPPQQDMANIKNIDLSEQGLLNVWEFGKQKLAERMRQAI